MSEIRQIMTTSSNEIESKPKTERNTVSEKRNQSQDTDMSKSK